MMEVVVVEVGASSISLRSPWFPERWILGPTCGTKHLGAGVGSRESGTSGGSSVTPIFVVSVLAVGESAGGVADNGARGGGDSSADASGSVAGGGCPGADGIGTVTPVYFAHIAWASSSLILRSSTSSFSLSLTYQHNIFLNSHFFAAHFAARCDTEDAEDIAVGDRWFIGRVGICTSGLARGRVGTNDGFVSISPR